MKKLLWGLLAAAVVAVGVWALLNRNGSVPVSPSSSADSQAESSSSSSAPSSAPSSSAPSSPESQASGLTLQEIEKKIQAEIPLDWTKYRLQEEKSNPVSTGGKTYRTFSIWDEDYMEGPLVLIGPDDGKVYTYTREDAAPMLPKDDPAFDKTVRTVTGTVQDGAMMSIEILTPEGNRLTIRRLGVELANLDDGFKIGTKVKVTYTGAYQGDSTQRMFVQKIEGVK